MVIHGYSNQEDTMPFTELLRCCNSDSYLSFVGNHNFLILNFRKISKLYWKQNPLLKSEINYGMEYIKNLERMILQTKKAKK